MLQRAAMADLDESVTFHLHDQSPPRPTRFAGTLRNDGIEDVADVALVAVVTHAQTVSAPLRSSRVPRNRFAWGIAPGNYSPISLSPRC